MNTEGDRSRSLSLYLFGEIAMIICTKNGNKRVKYMTFFKRKVIAQRLLSSASSSIAKHINRAGNQYLNAINDTRPESMVVMMERLSPLLQ